MKIGRNDMCPCGSGRKFKRCCMGKTRAAGSIAAPAPPAKLSLGSEIDKIQQAAEAREAKLREFGVFVLFSTEPGDAWLLEVSGGDAVQVAAQAERLAVEVDENPETIAINWTHTFAIRDKKFETKAYKDKSVVVYDNYPAHAIAAAVARIKRRISPDLLDTLHLEE